MAGASLIIEGGNLAAGSVTGGLGANGGGNGEAFGGGLFLQGNESITLAPAAGTVETIRGVVADQTGSGGTGANAGAGRLILDGPGTLDLTAANTFTGGIGIREGTLELANAKAAGSGKIHFASTSGELEYAAKVSVNIANTITGFGGADEIDFAKVKYAAGDHAVDNAGKVAIETSGGLDRRHVQGGRNLYVGQLRRRQGHVRRRSRDLRRHGRKRRRTFSDGTARRLRSRHRRRPATPLPSTPGPRSARAPGLIPAASTSTMTETRAARATSGASALAQTARSVTGLGLGSSVAGPAWLAMPVGSGFAG